MRHQLRNWRHEHEVIICFVFFVIFYNQQSSNSPNHIISFLLSILDHPIPSWTINGRYRNLNNNKTFLCTLKKTRFQFSKIFELKLIKLNLVSLNFKERQSSSSLIVFICINAGKIKFQLHFHKLINFRGNKRVFYTV